MSTHVARFQPFFQFLIHHFVLVKLDTSSIRVNMQSFLLVYHGFYNHRVVTMYRVKISKCPSVPFQVT